LEIADQEILNKAKVTVYYFHGKQRCKTCLAVQRIAEETISNNYANPSEVQFVEIDISDPENESIDEKYEIAFSSLLIATPAEKLNLTDEAFGLALSTEPKLKDLITTEVNNMLNL